MDSKSYDFTLPPLKRYKLFQHQTQNHPKFKPKSPQKSNLPAKKRKLSRVLPSPTPTYSLPAKKRIWAIPPFDLNLQIPDPNSPQKTIKTQIHHLNQVLDHQNQVLDDQNLVFDEENVVFDEEEEDDDDGIVCNICQSTDGDTQDPIVLCDGCDVMVHCSCYGHPLNKGVPEGDWFCQKCKSSRTEPNGLFNCCLCPISGGAMKATIDGKWSHVVCALFVPEVFFEDPEGREGVDCSMVPKARFEGVCYLCESKDGCVLDCCEKKCALSFHVMCGIKEELCVEYQHGKNKTDVVAGFCKKHTDLWQKQQQTGKYKIVAKD